MNFNMNNLQKLLFIINIIALLLICVNDIFNMVNVKISNNIKLALVISLIINMVLVKSNNEQYNNYYSMEQNTNDMEAENKWGGLYGGQQPNDYSNRCNGWNNLNYNHVNNKFSRNNCNKVQDKNQDAFLNLGPGDGSCYKSGINNTKPLYNELDNIHINYPNSSVTKKYLGTDKTQKYPSVNCNSNDPRKSMFMFSYNKCHPNCCPSPYSCSGGCVCLSNEQKKCLSNRGKTVDYLPGVPTPT